MMTTPPKKNLKVRAEFLKAAAWHAKYQRNNKRGGHKNLRCFPFCGPGNVHHEKGFCGSSICVDVTILGANDTYRPSKVLGWGEFVQRSEPSHVRFPPGSLFAQTDVDAVLRRDNEPFLPLLEATSRDLVSPDLMRLSFESQKKGWHYEWKGNKYTSDLPHAFILYVAVELQSGSFQCIGTFYSSDFTMFCRRRHKTVSEAEKHQMAVPPDNPMAEHELRNGLVPVTRGAPPQPPAPPSGASSSSSTKRKTSSNAARKHAKSSRKGRKESSDDDDFASEEEEEEDGDDDNGISPERDEDEDGGEDDTMEDEDDEDLTGGDDSEEEEDGANHKKPRREDEKKSKKAKAKATTTTTTSKKKAASVKRKSSNDNRSSSSAIVSGTPESSRKKRKKDLADTTEIDVKVMRILAAIANLDRLKRKIFQSPAPSSERMDQMDQQFAADMSWLDALAGPLNEAFFFTRDGTTPGADEDDLFLGGKVNLNDIFDFDDDHKNNNTSMDNERAKAVEVVEELARYMVDEDDITEAVQEAAAHGSYTEFLLSLQKSIEMFLRTKARGMTIDDLDAALRGDVPVAAETPGSTSGAIGGGGGGSSSSTQGGASGSGGNGGGNKKEMKSAFDTLVSAAIMREADESISTVSMMHRTGKASPKVVTKSEEGSRTKLPQFPPGVTLEELLRGPSAMRDVDEVDVAGVWIRPEENQATLARMREQREGSTLVQRQLLAKMEKRFELEQPKRGQIVARLSRKLLSAGVVVYDLNGVEEPFEMASPLGPVAQLAKSKTGWGVGPCACMRSTYDDRSRMTRFMWKIGLNELHGLHVYESKKGCAVWDTKPLIEESERIAAAATESSSSPAVLSPANEPLSLKNLKYPIPSEDGWECVYIAQQVCTRDQSTSAARNTTSSEAEDL